MEIPLNAQVKCSDGVCGRSEAVLINPVVGQVTHLIVKEDTPPHTAFIVPLDVLTETIAGTIQLRCNRAELEKMAPFIKTEFIEEKAPYIDYGFGSNVFGPGSYFYMPYIISDRAIELPVDQPQIPPDELAVRRGAPVEATDGYVGKVDEFVVNLENGHITHLVLRQGHLWGQREVIIPVTAMRETNQGTVFLNLSKHEIESLPNFPVHRRWL